MTDRKDGSPGAHLSAHLETPEQAAIEVSTTSKPASAGNAASTLSGAPLDTPADTSSETGLIHALEAILRTESHDPFYVLGPHADERDGCEGTVIRGFFPDAESAAVIASGEIEPRPMRRIHAAGFYEVFIPERKPPFEYRFQICARRSQETGAPCTTLDDPYRFPPLLTDFDLHLIAEGTHLHLYEKLGAHVRNVDGVSGVHFAVWAPNARGVAVIGDFNSWDSRRSPMRVRGGSGVWELFIPGLGKGQKYKYEIRTSSHPPVMQKADPLAFASEVRPRTASVVCQLEDYAWNDGEWMARRAQRDPLRQPMSIYEVHLGSWRRVPEEGHRFLTYRELAEELVPEVKGLGFTHIELLPITEHPFDGSWGYQTTGYFAPTSRYGSPQDFMYFVDRCHQAGLGVILDWVPGHFPNDWHGLMRFDGTHLYEHADPRKGQHPDWGTLIFNYGRNEVRNFLLSSALFWLDKYHIDGLRVDGVASMLYLDYSRAHGEWIPNQFGGRENLEAIAFLQKFNTVVHERPGVFTIAEESTAWPGVTRPVYLGGLGFTFKWNMGWMHDILEYMGKDPLYRKHHHNLLTFVMLYAFHENFILPLSHDEVVHGKRSLLDKMPGDLWQRFANLRLLYAYMYGQPGKKLLFMGGEFGQWREWNEAESLDWHLLEEAPHQQLQRFVRDLNYIYGAEPSLHQVDFEYAGFEWIDFHDADNSIICFIRRALNPDDFLVLACNFTPVPRKEYRVGVPEPGFYREVLNSDSIYYGGSNLGNEGGVTAEAAPWHNRPYSIRVTLPPLAMVIFKRV